MIELLFLLLPVAAASGWWLARRRERVGRNCPSQPHPQFMRGLNYLLDEQPDKAIDTFLELAEVDGETVETHLALGSLFRRRGEVDRAIRIHQNLVARSRLDPEQRSYALFELGQDYMRAGLLDRAEHLFHELVGLDWHRRRALLGLHDIYQQEREWERCLEIARQLRNETDHSFDHEIAHYHCELAEEARRKDDAPRVREHLAAALRANPGCARASLIDGRIALEDGDAPRAVELLMRVAEQRSAYLPEILPSLIDALALMDDADPLCAVESLAERHPESALIVALSDLLIPARGPQQAQARLIDHLERFADLPALARLLEIEAQSHELSLSQARRLHVVLEVVRQVAARQPVYQCEHCGFQARLLHWQCPSCKSWDSVIPAHAEPIISAPPSGPRLA